MRRKTCCTGQCSARDESSTNIRRECGDREGRAQGGEMQLREGNSLAQGHTVGKCQSWEEAQTVWLHMALLITHESSLPRPLAWGLDTADAQGLETPSLVQGSAF